MLAILFCLLQAVKAYKDGRVVEGNATKYRSHKFGVIGCVFGLAFVITAIIITLGLVLGGNDDNDDDDQ